MGHFLAGCDEDRLAGINDALSDSDLRAIITTRGGKGPLANVPSPWLGTSNITILHLALWQAGK